MGNMVQIPRHAAPVMLGYSPVTLGPRLTCRLLQLLSAVAAELTAALSGVRISFYRLSSSVCYQVASNCCTVTNNAVRDECPWCTSFYLIWSSFWVNHWSGLLSLRWSHFVKDQTTVQKNHCSFALSISVCVCTCFSHAVFVQVSFNFLPYLIYVKYNLIHSTLSGIYWI